MSLFECFGRLQPFVILQVPRNLLSPLLSSMIDRANENSITGSVLSGAYAEYQHFEVRALIFVGNVSPVHQLTHSKSTLHKLY
jgi:predicted esterase YcpF (UPF0227 family)